MGRAGPDPAELSPRQGTRGWQRERVAKRTREPLNGIEELGQGPGLVLSLEQSENVNGEVVTRQTTETKTTPFFLDRNPVIYPIDQLLCEPLKVFGLLSLFLPPLPHVGKFRIRGTRGYVN